jgi:hypothetical protein
MKIIIKTILGSCLAVLLATNIQAENNPSNNPAPAKAALSGKVLDAASGESLAGVEVSILNTDIKTYTDLDGNFTFSNLKSGTYDVVVSMISYDKSFIDDFIIESGKKNSVDVKLKSVK